MKKLTLYLCPDCGETRGEFQGTVVKCRCIYKQEEDAEKALQRARWLQHQSNLDMLEGV